VKVWRIESGEGRANHDGAYVVAERWGRAGLSGVSNGGEMSGQVMLEFDNARALTDVIRDYYQEHKGVTKRTVAQEYFGAGYGDIRS
jgi:hypothetical protein